jgi:hypothetical protein
MARRDGMAALVGLLEHKDDQVRRDAATGLGPLVPAATEHVPASVRTLHGSLGATIRVAVGTALAGGPYRDPRNGSSVLCGRRGHVPEACPDAGGSPRDFGSERLSGRRMFRVQGFRRHLVFYRPTSEGIEVIRVLHSSQDIENIFGQDS